MLSVTSRSKLIIKSDLRKIKHWWIFRKFLVQCNFSFTLVKLDVGKLIAHCPSHNSTGAVSENVCALSTQNSFWLLLSGCQTAFRISLFCFYCLLQLDIVLKCTKGSRLSFVVQVWKCGWSSSVLMLVYKAQFCTARNHFRDSVSFSNRKNTFIR